MDETAALQRCVSRDIPRTRLSWKRIRHRCISTVASMQAQRCLKVNWKNQSSGFDREYTQVDTTVGAFNVSRCISVVASTPRRMFKHQMSNRAEKGKITGQSRLPGMCMLGRMGAKRAGHWVSSRISCSEDQDSSKQFLNNASISTKITRHAASAWS